MDNPNEKKFQWADTPQGPSLKTGLKDGPWGVSGIFLAALLYFVDVSTATAQQITNPLGNVTICGLLSGILNAFLIIGAPIAVVFVIIAGAKYVLAMGKPDAIRSATNNLKWTLIGIAIFFGAIVITRVIFSTVSAFLAQHNQQALNCTI